MPDPVDVTVLISLFNQLQRRGVKYVYGGKVDNKSVNPRSNGRLSTPPDTIDGLDCSGFIRYALYQAATWVVPDGSENQLLWFQEGGFSKLGSDVNKEVGRNALSLSSNHMLMAVAILGTCGWFTNRRMVFPPKLSNVTGAQELALGPGIRLPCFTKNIWHSSCPSASRPSKSWANLRTTSAPPQRDSHRRAGDRRAMRCEPRRGSHPGGLFERPAIFSAKPRRRLRGWRAAGLHRLRFTPP